MTPNEYLRSRLAAVQPRLSWRPDAAWVEEARRAIIDAISCVGEPWPKPGFTVLDETEEDGWTRFDVRFASREGWDGVGWLVVPKGINEPGPAVVCLPGHGKGADVLVGLQSEDYQPAFALECVKRGWVALAIEQVSFGRQMSEPRENRGSSCLLDSMMSLSLGETMTGWRVRDAIAGVRALATLPEVDANRIATLGISGGGLTALWAAAVEPQILAAGVSGYFTPMKSSIHNVDHCPDNYVPGIAHLLDVPDLAGLIAPRWLAVENGTEDPIFEISGFREASEKASAIYGEAGYGDAGYGERFTSEAFEGGHVFRGDTLFAHFERAFQAE